MNIKEFGPINLEIEQLDLKTTFLQSYFEKEHLNSDVINLKKVYMDSRKQLNSDILNLIPLWLGTGI